MKILAADGEGDAFRVNLSLSAKTPSEAILPLGSPENGFLEETRFLNKITLPYHALCFLSKKLFFCNKTTQKKDHRCG